MTKVYGIVTYKLEVVSGIAANVLYDIAVGHPFRDHKEPPALEGVRNPNEIKDVWMGQILPYGSFLTEVLYGALADEKM